MFCLSSSSVRPVETHAIFSFTFLVVSNFWGAKHDGVQMGQLGAKKRRIFLKLQIFSNFVVTNSQEYCIHINIAFAIYSVASET